VLKRLRSNLTYANVMATLAVFAVLTGVGYAVARSGKVTTRQIKNGAVTSKKIHKDAVNANKIRSGAVGRSELANGAVGTGKISNSAVITKKLANGAVTTAKVDSNSLPFLSTLHSGQTLRGSFNLGGTVTTDRGGETFQFPLTNAPSGPAANVIDASVPNPAFTSNCPGIGGGNAQTPNAAAGQLCVYITSSAGTTPALAIDSGALTRLGFGLTGTWAAAAGANQIRGQWAVTAP
jgi:hypothetical protein